MEIRVRVRRLRVNAARASAKDRERHPGSFVALLWDDPNRLVGARRVES